MEGFLPSLSHVLGIHPGGGGVNDESDSCISERLQNVHPGKVNYWVNDLPQVQHLVPWVHVNRPSA